MGLDTTHDAFHGSYSSFNYWRVWIGKQIGIPLRIMEGFHKEGSLHSDIFIMIDFDINKRLKDLRDMLPLKWENFKSSALHKLLNHSDCEGYINWPDCIKITKELNKIINNIKSDDFNENRMLEITKDFIKGCELAYKNKEKIHFY